MIEAVLAGLLASASVYLHTYYHELAHKQICEYYKNLGLVDVDCGKIHVGLTGGHVKIKVRGYRTPSDLRSFVEKQSEVDIIGYHMFPLILILSIGTGLVLGSLWGVEKNTRQYPAHLTRPIPLSHLTKPVP